MQNVNKAEKALLLLLILILKLTPRHFGKVALSVMKFVEMICQSKVENSENIAVVLIASFCILVRRSSMALHDSLADYCSLGRNTKTTDLLL